MRLFDAHCHLQDPRLSNLPPLLATARAAGVQAWTLNATRESDWPAVLQLARQIPGALPALGLHPWWQKERSTNWDTSLLQTLAQTPHASLGETGLDLWMPQPDLPDQIHVLQRHLEIARDLHRPVTLHCLRAWSELQRVLRQFLPLPAGFLLHSYAAPPEMTPFWIQAGAFFSFSPAFLHPRKTRQRQLFASLPLDRLLVETDAPDMAPPQELSIAPLSGPEGPLNHPANLVLCVQALAADRGLTTEAMAEILWKNAQTFFNP